MTERVDALHPLQARAAGMDAGTLGAEFGGGDCSGGEASQGGFGAAPGDQAQS